MYALMLMLCLIGPCRGRRLRSAEEEHDWEFEKALMRLRISADVKLGIATLKQAKPIPKELLHLSRTLLAYSQGSMATATPSATKGILSNRYTADAVFADVVRRCELLFNGVDVEEDLAQFAKVPTLLREVFDADFERYCSNKISQPLTCLRPSVINLDADSLQDMFGTISGKGLTDVHLESGRLPRGACSAKCSRAALPEVASQAECEELCRRASAFMAPQPSDGEELDADECVLMTQMSLAACAAEGDIATSLLIVRLVERLRRAVAHEYSLPLASVAPHSVFVSRWQVETCKGTPLHGDEAACDGFHYSTVLHLSTQGEQFEGGDFVFSDGIEPAASDSISCSCNLNMTTDRHICACADATSETRLPADSVSIGGAGASEGRLLTRFRPQRGRALMFSSGWENLHFVDEIRSGVRHAMPAFFVTKESWATDGPDDRRAAVSTQDVTQGLLANLLYVDIDELDDSVFLGDINFASRWHSMFAAPIAT